MKAKVIIAQATNETVDALYELVSMYDNVRIVQQ